MKKLLQPLLFLLIVACTDKIEKEYSEILDIVLSQYPMYVNISPQGNEILLKKRDRESFNLYTSELTTSDLNIIDSSEFTQLSLTWRPDEKKIIFQQFNPKKRMYDLFELDPNSKNRTSIGLPSSNNAIPPIRWSQSGKYLAYMATNRSSTLYIYDYDNKEIKKSFQDLSSYSDFQWANDSTIFYIKNPKRPVLKKANLYTREIKEFSLVDIEVVAHDFSIKQKKILFIGRTSSDEYFQCYELNMDEELIKNDFWRFQRFQLSLFKI